MVNQTCEIILRAITKRDSLHYYPIKWKCDSIFYDVIFEIDQSEDVCSWPN